MTITINNDDKAANYGEDSDDYDNANDFLLATSLRLGMLLKLPFRGPPGAMLCYAAPLSFAPHCELRLQHLPRKRGLANGGDDYDDG